MVDSAPRPVGRARAGGVWGLVAPAVALLLLAAGCGRTAAPASSGAPAASKAPAAPRATAEVPAVIPAVGAENEYANVIAQIGGRYVRVVAVESNPNTDPHTFEASAAVGRELAAADLVVMNGLGYDDWAQRMLTAAPNPTRKVIDVQTLLGLPNNTPNPHLWYAPTTMPAVAKAIAADLSALQPAHAVYFRSQVTKFTDSLQPWYAAIAAFKAKYAGTPVAVTEPVGDYLLQAAGCDIATPFSLQAAIMNGTDPAPQDVTVEQNLFRDHRVKVFVYNQQVTDPLTQSFETLARHEGIPIVGVYETMPTGYTYQSWMLAELQALERAVAHKTSTTKL